MCKTKWGVDGTREQLIALEKLIVHKLDFELHYTSPLIFLERYLRLFCLDRPDTDSSS